MLQILRLKKFHFLCDLTVVRNDRLAEGAEEGEKSMPSCSWLRRGFLVALLAILVWLVRLPVPVVEGQVMSGGAGWAWGANGYGKLGDGTTTDRSTPVQVKGPGGVGFLTGVAAMTGGVDHSLARKTDGTVWAWGFNRSGQLGVGTTTDSSTPVQVKGPGGVGFLTGVATIAGNGGFPSSAINDAGHSLARKTDGTVWAWGNNFYSQLGDGTTTTRPTPVQVKGPGGVGFLTGVATIAAGRDHSLTGKTDGTVWGWGHGGFGQLGDGIFDPLRRPTPVQVKGPGGVGFLTGVATIAAGEFHSLALKTDGTVWAWGNNGNGQLGDGTTTTRPTPVQVRGVPTIAAVEIATGTIAGGEIATGTIAGGESHSLAVAPSVVPAGFDLFETVPEFTQFQFAEEFTIRANFFDPGSIPFSDTVGFTGVPLDPENLSTTDTIVRRTQPLVLPPPFPRTEIILIELVALSLVSTEPITVTYEDESTELWDVEVAVSPTQPSTGTMAATKRDPGGGTFDSSLSVFPLFTFTRQTDGETRVFDVGAVSLPPASVEKITLRAEQVPWVHEHSPGVLVVPGQNDWFSASDTADGPVQTTEQAWVAAHVIRPPAGFEPLPSPESLRIP